MSYIRSGSNPESLYIWGDNDTVYFAVGSKQTKKMPKNVFHGLIRKYHRENDTDVSFKGASLCERWIKTPDGKNESKIVLGYNTQSKLYGWECIMWGVTWDSIAYTNLENINRRAKQKIIIE